MLISIVSPVQHFEDLLHISRRFPIAIFNPDRISSPDRKQFTPDILYLILRSIGFLFSSYYDLLCIPYLVLFSAARFDLHCQLVACGPFG